MQLLEQLCAPKLGAPFWPELHQSVFVSVAAVPILQLFVVQHEVTNVE